MISLALVMLRNLTQVQKSEKGWTRAEHSLGSIQDQKPNFISSLYTVYTVYGLFFFEGWDALTWNSKAYSYAVYWSKNIRGIGVVDVDYSSGAGCAHC